MAAASAAASPVAPPPTTATSKLSAGRSMEENMAPSGRFGNVARLPSSGGGFPIRLRRACACLPGSAQKAGHAGWAGNSDGGIRTRWPRGRFSGRGAPTGCSDDECRAAASLRRSSPDRERRRPGAAVGARGLRRRLERRLHLARDRAPRRRRGWPDRPALRRARAAAQMGRRRDGRRHRLRDLRLRACHHRGAGAGAAATARHRAWRRRDRHRRRSTTPTRG